MKTTIEFNGIIYNVISKRGMFYRCDNKNGGIIMFVAREDGYVGIVFNDNKK